MDENGLIIFVLHNVVALYKTVFMLTASVGVLGMLSLTEKNKGVGAHVLFFLSMVLLGVGVFGYFGAEDMVFNQLAEIIKSQSSSI